MLSLQAPVYTSACQGLVQRLPFGFVRLPEESCAACSIMGGSICPPKGPRMSGR